MGKGRRGEGDRRCRVDAVLQQYSQSTSLGGMRRVSIVPVASTALSTVPVQLAHTGGPVSGSSAFGAVPIFRYILIRALVFPTGAHMPALQRDGRYTAVTHQATTCGGDHVSWAFFLAGGEPGLDVTGASGPPLVPWRS